MKMMMIAMLGLLALQDGVSPDLLEYRPNGRIEGALELGPPAGFESLLSRWADRMKQHYPDLRGGRPEAMKMSTPEALTKGACRFGILSRRWTDGEVEDFRTHWGFFPTWFAIGGDALSIVVHPENPIRSLQLDQIDAAFSSTCRRGGKAAATWGDLGLKGDWQDVPIRCYGSSKETRARTAFQLRALQGGAFRQGVKELPGTDTVLLSVADDPSAIGYVSGIVNAQSNDPTVRVVPILPPGGNTAVSPDTESILSLSYPLAWRVYIAVRKAPGIPVDPEVAEFLRLVLSRDGQEILASEGLVPVTGRFARKELLKVK